MLMSTVVAVALGLVPIHQDPTVLDSAADYSAAIGHYSQTVDRRGTTYLRGEDANGRSYELVMDKNGNVEASFGERVITFRVTQAA